MRTPRTDMPHELPKFNNDSYIELRGLDNYDRTKIDIEFRTTARKSFPHCVLMTRLLLFQPTPYCFTMDIRAVLMATISHSCSMVDMCILGESTRVFLQEEAKNQDYNHCNKCAEA